MSEQIALTKLKSGKCATIVDIQGGTSVTERLENMGITIGKKIEKLSGMPAHGPVTLKVGNARVSIGYGAAEKIMVSPEGK